MPLHYQDERAEIHKLVVGPMDNNVFVLRCTETGEAVLLDAANDFDADAVLQDAEDWTP